MNMLSPKVCKRIADLFRRTLSPNEGEAMAARKKLLELLEKHKLSMHDVPHIIIQADRDAGNVSPGPSPSQPQPGDPPEVNVLDLVLRLVELHIAIPPDERMAVALWVLHTHVYDHYTITPRLALISPVKGCGKTTLLTLLEMLTANPERNDSVTAASLYYDLAVPRTLLLDEADNLGLLNTGNKHLRTVLNGNKRGSHVKRHVRGRPCRLSVFTPIAIAAIGMLPLPLMDRSIVVQMQRSRGDHQRLDEDDLSFVAAREQITRWAAHCQLQRDPEMSPALRNRAGDKWRVLIAIADDLGHGDEAREVALRIHAGRPDEDVAVVLLRDIRSILLALGVDRISSAALVERLLELDDGMWSDWRGPNDDRPPRKLNQSDLSRMLRPFGIRPKTIWPANRVPGSRSSRGYMRSWFEAAWASYCQDADTTTQRSKVIGLPHD